jgi:dGTPase
MSESLPTSHFVHEMERLLAPYAYLSLQSRGRRHPEPHHPYRTPFQRDRERIVHSTAFRRLVGKTQVLVGRINDHHRTRLTHTLEVAQISRTIARRLRLNEDLTEAIALSHDLGHSPFGHAGETALNECLKDHGGFDHNHYGLRRVELLEERYPEFPGLNLTWEVREAFAQHSKRKDHPEIVPYLGLGQPFLEAQLADATDSLAYDTHDIDDAVGIGLIGLDDLEEVTLWRMMAQTIRQTYSNLNPLAFRTAVIRELIAWQVGELIAETERRLFANEIHTVDDVRECDQLIIEFNAEVTELKKELQQFLRDRVYKHHQVLRMANKGQMILRRLFQEFLNNPHLLPERYQLRWADSPLRKKSRPPSPSTYLEPSLPRVIADYLAGMTDRFAREEYLRLFHPDNDV